MAQMTSNLQDTPSSTILTWHNIDFWNHVFLRTFLVKVNVPLEICVSLHQRVFMDIWMVGTFYICNF